MLCLGISETKDMTLTVMNAIEMYTLLKIIPSFPTSSTELMMAIEDIIIKTIIAGEVPICSSLCYQPYHGNCFGQSTAAIL